MKRKVEMDGWAVKFIKGNTVVSDLDCRGGQVFIFQREEQARQFLNGLTGEKNPTFKIIKVKIKEGER